jgi:hypothetical protein
MNEAETLALAEVAYRAYGNSTGNKNFRGEEMPKFDALPDAIKKAWMAAVRAMLIEFLAARKSRMA